MKILCRIIILLMLMAVPVSAQDEPEASVSYGGVVSGQITNANPRAVYFFDGLRGEVISIHLETTNGNLDPVLTVLDAGGQLIARADDSRGSRDVTIDALSIPSSSRYYVVVGRFGYGLGSTTGAFELDMERIGVSSASGSALRYGDSVINNISNMTPQLYYSFRAERGDIVNIRMQRNSGDLDSYLQVVDSSAFVIADNDDVPGSGLDAEITNLVVEAAGTYIIKATRYGEAVGTSSGQFILTLQEAENSGFGNSPQTAIPLLVNQIEDGELTNQNYTRYYVFDAKQNDLITVRMDRVQGSVDAFLVLADANLQEITTDDDGGGGQNAKIDGFLIPSDGTYYILATRFDREAGTTAGSFRLELQSLGNAFDGVSPETQRISYGTTITGRIDEITPTVSFAFWGVEGDAVTVSLNRGDGDLDPVVRILDSNGTVVAEDDDSGGGKNARVARFVLPRTGIYTIEAARFSGLDGDPNTRGSFILVLARVFR
ncbi:MAG: PPC domain-containing protein [Anaerolineae bacterium]|nr:PPC domain-containing protein [Anaerolineae bacterium]